MKNNKSHLTAIKRNNLSSPVSFLLSHNLLPKTGVLDFGCGRGEDADILGFEKYDPHYFPNAAVLDKKWETIICNYVLNVVEEPNQYEILWQIYDILKYGGAAYISVRRDIKKEGFTKNGTFQRNVVLHYPVLVDKKGKFCIYKMTKY